MKNIIFKLKARLFKKTRFFSNVYIKNSNNIFLGEKAKILRGCSLIATRGTIHIGDKVHLNRMVSIHAAGKEIILESGVEVNEGSLLMSGGKIEIKKNTIIGPGVKLIAYQHTFSDITIPIKHQPLIDGDIFIDENSWIGANAVIMSNVRIGRNVVIGAGAIVNKDIPDYSVAVGCPARVIRNLSSA
jgi:acetyltransferase-like isoleucine patch superfamily enzyme